MVFCHMIPAPTAVDEYVIKAQILAGGRGKGVFNTGFKGGVHLTKKLAILGALPLAHFIEFVFHQLFTV